MHKSRFAGRLETHGRKGRFKHRGRRGGSLRILHVGRMGYTGSTGGQVTY